MNQPQDIGFFRWLVKSKKAKFLFISLMLFIPLMVFIYAVFIPALLYTPQFSAETTISNDTTAADTLRLNKESRAQLKQITQKESDHLFQKNRLLLAKQDSIYLLLNLPDSTITLEIKGLPIKICKILAFKVSKKISAASHEDIQNWLSKPFVVSNEIATIPRIPFLIVDAPKDTIEAAKLPRKASEPEKTYVQYTLWFDRDLTLEVKQFEEPLPEEAEIVSRYKAQYDSAFRRPLIQKIMHPMPDNLPLHIKIVLSAADARSIYRAIPHSNSANLVLKPK